MNADLECSCDFWIREHARPHAVVILDVCDGVVNLVTILAGPLTQHFLWVDLAGAAVGYPLPRLHDSIDPAPSSTYAQSGRSIT